MLALLVATTVVSADPAIHPLKTDCTGIQWVLPFNEARDAARERKRLLMIKPVAFGTSPDGGW